MKSNISLNILLCLLIAYSKATEFRYTATLHCDIGSVWCFMIEFMEDDTFGVDHIGNIPHKCYNTSKVVQKFVGRLDGTDGIFDHVFEPFMKIQHNCSDKHIDGPIMHQLPTVPSSASIFVLDDLYFNLRNSAYNDAA